ncbi:hypothetical protein vBVpaMR16F_15 [Vibrio phage vB_VpaM_R16F]|nr:hypothetical protein vBVpaMR16F_15 [Vibrio phage vB_VpaM_R16F]
MRRKVFKVVGWVLFFLLMFLLIGGLQLINFKMLSILTNS